jgi:hypothetical protein
MDLTSRALFKCLESRSVHFSCIASFAPENYLSNSAVTSIKKTEPASQSKQKKNFFFWSLQKFNLFDNILDLSSSKFK